MGEKNQEKKNENSKGSFQEVKFLSQIAKRKNRKIVGRKF